MEIKFDKDPLARVQNNYVTKIVNISIVYNLYAWTKIALRNFTIKNCLFGATSRVKKSDKQKWVYSDYGIAFYRKGELRFGSDTARNVVIFGIDNNDHLMLIFSRIIF